MKRFMSRNTSALRVGVFLFIFTPTILGQELPPGASGNTTPKALKNLTLEELSKIELTTVSKESTEAFITPAAISVLTRQDIARSGATTIPDLLRQIPGVEVMQIASDKWAIGIRGFANYLSKNVLVMIDGRSVYTPLFAGVYWDMQDTLIEDIDRIEVIRGPGGTIWGSNAVNGVINIITTNARDTRGGLVTARGGNVEQGALGMRFGGGSTTFAYRVWGKGFTRAPQYHPDGRNYDDWRKGQTGFRADWSPTLADNITISGDAYTTEAGTKVGISTYSPPEMTLVERNADLSGQNIVGAWRRRFQSDSDIQVRAYFDRADRKDLNYHEVRKTFDIDLIHHLNRSVHDIIWGAGLRRSPSRFFQTVPTVDFQPEKQTYSIYSGFAQDSISLISNRVKVSVGSKFEHNSFSGFEVQPSGRVAWTPTERHTVWAAVTRAVRTPSHIEEGFRYTALAGLVPPNSPPLFLRLIGDGEFTPERMVGYELGFRAYLQNRGFVAVNGFYNRYDHVLSVENSPPAPEASPTPLHLVLPLFLRNGIEVQTKGVEVSSLWDLNSWWRMKPSYSYVHLNAERIPGSNDASTVKQIEGDTPSHKVNAKSIFTLPQDIDVDITYRYISKIPGQKVPAYSTADARIAKRLNHGFELSLVGLNLLQPHHPEYGGLPGGIVEIRRAGYIQLAWRR